DDPYRPRGQAGAQAVPGTEQAGQRGGRPGMARQPLQTPGQVASRAESLFGVGETNRIRCLARRRCMSCGSFLAAALVPPSVLLAAGCSNPPAAQQADQPATAICGVCRVGTSGGPAGGGGQRPPVPEEGVKLIVRDSRGKRTIAEATSGKGGEYKIALPRGEYEVQAVLRNGP